MSFTSILLRWADFDVALKMRVIKAMSVLLIDFFLFYFFSFFFVFFFAQLDSKGDGGETDGAAVVSRIED